MSRNPQADLQAQQTAAPYITLGVVVDTNDPSQMGRLRVMCPALKMCCIL